MQSQSSYVTKTSYDDINFGQKLLRFRKVTSENPKTLKLSVTSVTSNFQELLVEGIYHKKKQEEDKNAPFSPCKIREVSVNFFKPLSILFK